MRRRVWFSIVLSVGVALMVVSYFWLTAPWGATNEASSQPRMEVSPALFVLGVMFAFGSAVVYELIPDESDQE